jgi:hypothetical protein
MNQTIGTCILVGIAASILADKCYPKIVSPFYLLFKKLLRVYNVRTSI